MGDPFTNASCFVSPSLNKVRIIDLPGLNFPTRIRNKTGFELLSAGSLRVEILLKAGKLGLDARAPDLIKQFDGCLISDSPSERAAAEMILKRYGQNLGYLLLTLKRGDEVNRTSREEWDEAHWGYWRGINTVWIGGGLAAGNMGPKIAGWAEDVMREAGYSKYSVRPSQYGRELPLYGAARHASSGIHSSVLLDFGQTSVKRGEARYERGTFFRFHNFGHVEAPCARASEEEGIHNQAEKRFGEMTKYMAEATNISVDSGLGNSRSLIVASIAAYLRHGSPIYPDRGCYGCLSLLEGYLPDRFSEALRLQIGRPISVQLIHDGAAAASMYAGVDNSVVLMLGTAIGIGFPPETKGLRPLAPYFEAQF